MLSLANCTVSAHAIHFLDAQFLSCIHAHSLHREANCCCQSPVVTSKDEILLVPALTFLNSAQLSVFSLYVSGHQPLLPSSNRSNINTAIKTPSLPVIECISSTMQRLFCPSACRLRSSLCASFSSPPSSQKGSSFDSCCYRKG